MWTRRLRNEPLYQILILHVLLQMSLCFPTICCSTSNDEFSGSEYFLDYAASDNATRAGPWPKNVTVELTSATSVRVRWAPSNDTKIRLQMEYNPIRAKYRIISEVLPQNEGCKVLERLLPKTWYQVRLVGLLNKTISWSSPAISFFTDNIIKEPEKTFVRAEEVGIVLLVLAFWMFAIALFFNRWGKIRMLEPYFEPFKEEEEILHSHRASCPGLVEPCLVSKLKFMEYTPTTRPRLGSLAVVGRSYSITAEMPPRRARSAVNLTSLILHECDEESGASGLNNVPSSSVGSVTTAV